MLHNYFFVQFHLLYVLKQHQKVNHLMRKLLKVLNKRFAFSTPILISLTLITLFIIMRLYLAYIATIAAVPFDDTPAFFRTSSAPLFSKTLWAGVRPPLVPLLYKFAHNNYSAIIYLQTVISITCWFFLAWSLLHWLQSAVGKTVAFCIVVSLGTCEPIIVWESCLLSESISISLLAAMIGAWLLYLKDTRRANFIVLLSLSVCWIFCRETNPWMILILTFFLLPITLLKKNRRFLIMISIFIGVFALHDISSSIGKRWAFPLLNVISRRILPDEKNRAFFERHGMPITPTLLARTNRCASCDNYAYYNDPALENFRKWFYAKAKQTYILWLVSHPATTMREPLSNIEYMVASGSLFHHASPSSKRVLPSPLSKLVFPIGYARYFSLVMVWFLILGTGIAIGSGVWKKENSWVVGILLVILAYPHFIIVWHGDVVGFEIERHSLAARVQLNIAFWIMASLLIDRIIVNAAGLRSLLIETITSVKQAKWK